MDRIGAFERDLWLDSSLPPLGWFDEDLVGAPPTYVVEAIQTPDVAFIRPRPEAINGTGVLVAPAAQLYAEGRVQQRIRGRGELTAARVRLEGAGAQDLVALEDEELVALDAAGAL